MSTLRVVPLETIEAQRRASDPRTTVWVSANAGSGKTHVLAQRVVRLLLEGVPPSRILCLTYTKAAAANMSQRVFDTLAKWTTLDDETLESAIKSTGAQPQVHQMVIARKLFARAVETPGGLKIQTIHAFCERLLHLFPFEANVPARFELMEDRERSEMLEAARREALAEAIATPDGALGRAVQTLSSFLSEASLTDALHEALALRIEVEDEPDANRRNLARRLGLETGETRGDIERRMIEGAIAPQHWAALADKLARGSKTDIVIGDKVRRALSLANSERLEAWLDVFLTQKLEPRGVGAQKIITKALWSADPELLSSMEKTRDWLVALVRKRRAMIIVENSVALFAIAGRVRQIYQRTKNARALVDFDDLISKTSSLLTRVDAGWVLYKLDAGIDHILVDEAQDTSPEQWDILRRLAEEFSSGRGARTQTRTLFAVGDEKQSIYSFQGARPEKFAQMKSHFQRRVIAAQGNFSEVKLNASFRSAPGVLQAVDSIFEALERRKGLQAEDLKLVHQPLKLDLPSRVEIWDVIKKTQDAPPPGWRMPLDAIDPASPALVVARDVANLIGGWLHPDSPDRVIDQQTGEPRPIRAGDVIVLVRTRAAFFEAIIRALKNSKPPVNVAGADRLKFAEHIAVMDLVAAGRAALLPQDDLTLACVLKSPLIGLDDDDLIELAPRRKGSLIQALEASEKETHRLAAARLALWRDRARKETPFGFYALLLGADGGRRDLIARLGIEAGDAIDEFVLQTLKHERGSAPSLAGFLANLETIDSEVKRDMEAAGDAVRVMTVHAAKGLEAKIVILADTCTKPAAGQAAKLFTLEGANGAKAIAWSPRKDDDTPEVAAARERIAAAVDDEYRRLLYVAVTRAEERLYVMGYEGAKGRPNGCWYDLIRSALEPRAEIVEDDPIACRTIFRLDDRLFPPQSWPVPAPAPEHSLKVPSWLRLPARPERETRPPIRPSTALAAASSSPRSREGASDAAGIGAVIHYLLQYLPSVEVDRRASAASRFLALRAPALDEPRRKILASRALAVINLPMLAPLFGPLARAEVSIAASVEARPGLFVDIVGQIDRLVATDSEVLFADFKSGAPRPVAETPEPYLVQIALYQAALAQAWPGKRVRAFLVWTNGPEVIEFDHEMLVAALARAPIT